MASQNEIRKRIKAVESTSKITNAMKLVASAKLKKQKDMFNNQTEYYKKFYDLFSYIKINAEIDTFFKKKNEDGKTIWLCFFSTMGLCGSFNINLVKELKKHVSKQDQIWLIGKKGKPIMKSKNILNEITLDVELEDKDINYDLCYLLADNLLKTFNDNYDIKSVKMIYSNFVNSLSFVPKVFSLLPLDKIISESRLEKPKNGSEYHIKPSADELFKSVLNDYLATCIYGAIIESKLCENASRRNAMEASTKNANELIKNYKLELNRKRQSDITQEITEIISGTGGD
ncbi:MAG: F0F1 ATP synthase subunit gamma [Malacoplasma sp.]|nr:F0F1 ATP synthase subunit gamma [Malacoplasma sp.]MDE6646209.1 F0F1 ATP synthase subunit gamma [Malacoplasma sp.]MDE6893842.1 F0F1 ATP synthase subunit gamma [Malacoplasma sp.]MDE7075215.1 F0F1 ATP synthase subunit gamma [Malacoplasma sp.]MDE7088406.1 F0F1 ATP synthase subunit gamma [Malacoplasma sp.]